MYQLHKRVLLPQLPMEWLDVVPPTLHFRPSQEMVWVLRVCIVVGEKGAWEHLEDEMQWSMNYRKSIHVLSKKFADFYHQHVVYTAIRALETSHINSVVSCEGHK